MSSLPDLLVTLIHGTFEPQARWTQPDSPFVRDLPSTPNQSVRCDRFEWSGENTHRDREAGAAKLRAHIRNENYTDAAAQRLLIAHSHGGNVVLHALLNGDICRRVSAVVYLNTPFILCERRGLWWLWYIIHLLDPAFLPMLLVMAFAFYRLVVQGAGMINVLLTGLPLMIIASWLCSLLARYPRVENLADTFLNSVEARQEQGYQALASPDTTGVRLLAITVRLDEAYWYLWTLDRLSRYISIGIPLSITTILSGWILNQFVSELIRLVGIFYRPWASMGWNVQRTSVVLFLAGVLMFLGSIVVMAVLLPLVRAHRKGYGEAVMDSLLLKIFVRPLPPAHPPSTLRRFPARIRSLLRHSALHSDPTVVRFVAQWFSTPETSD